MLWMNGYSSFKWHQSVTVYMGIENYIGNICSHYFDIILEKMKYIAIYFREKVDYWLYLLVGVD